MRIIRLKDVIDSTGLARSTIYKYIADSTFPKPVSLGERCVGWVEERSTIGSWPESRRATWLTKQQPEFRAR